VPYHAARRICLTNGCAVDQWKRRSFGPTGKSRARHARTRTEESGRWASNNNRVKACDAGVNSAERPKRSSQHHWTQSASPADASSTSGSVSAGGSDWRRGVPDHARLVEREIPKRRALGRFTVLKGACMAKASRTVPNTCLVTCEFLPFSSLGGPGDLLR